MEGQTEFVEAAISLLKRGCKYTFLIVGDEIYDTTGERDVRATLQGRIDNSGFSDRIKITGFRSDMPAVYNTLDVLVHASIKPEPFGRVIVEAMSCGTAVVASRDGGVLEIIQDGVSGLLYEPGNVSEMSGKIQALLSDEVLRKRISAEGRQRVLERFSFAVFSKRIVTCFRSLLASA